MARGKIRKQTRARVRWFRAETREKRNALRQLADDLDTFLNCHGFFQPNEDPEKLKIFVREAEGKGITVNITVP